MTQETEKSTTTEQETTTEIALNETTDVPVVVSNIMPSIYFEEDIVGNAQATADILQAANEEQDIEVLINEKYWTPEEKGQRKVLVLFGHETRFLPKFGDKSADAPLFPIPHIRFVELYIDNGQCKQKMIAMAQKAIVMTFANTNGAEIELKYPVGSVFAVTYKGKEKQSSGFEACQFDIRAIPVKKK